MKILIHHKSAHYLIIHNKHVFSLHGINDVLIPVGPVKEFDQSKLQTTYSELTEEEAQQFRMSILDSLSVLNYTNMISN